MKYLAIFVDIFIEVIEYMVSGRELIYLTGTGPKAAQLLYKPPARLSRAEMIKELLKIQANPAIGGAIRSGYLSYSFPVYEYVVKTQMDLMRIIARACLWGATKQEGKIFADPNTALAELIKAEKKTNQAHAVLSDITTTFNEYFKAKYDGENIRFSHAELAMLSHLISRQMIAIEADGRLVVCGENVSIIFLSTQASAESRRHEINHALYYSNAEYRQEVERIWLGLNSEERTRADKELGDFGYIESHRLSEFAAFAHGIIFLLLFSTNERGLEIQAKLLALEDRYLRSQGD